MGIENRGTAGNALAFYAGSTMETSPVLLRAAIEADARTVQLSRESAFSFRSAMIEAGTGSFLTGPFDGRIRVQVERFVLSNASVYSIIPLLSFDIDFFFVSMGFNFRTFTMDDGNPFDPFFSAFERQFTFEIGCRVDPTDWLRLGFSMRNFDDYGTGSFASIGYALDCKLKLERCIIGLEIGIEPAGAIALAATTSGLSFRVIAEKKL